MPAPEGALYTDYQEYQQDSHFTWDTGLVALPIAGSTPAAKVIRLHGGYGKRILNFNETRQGRPPVIPTMTDTMNDTFLSGDVTMMTPIATQTSSGYTWNVRGEYEYIQLAPRVVGTNTFPVGLFPGSMQTQDLAASTISGTMSVTNPYTPMTQIEYDTYWNGVVTTAGVNLTTGQWTWPFLAYPTIFSSQALIAN